MVTLYTHKDSNIHKTWLLMGAFLIVIIGLGWFFSGYFGNPAILYGAVVFSFAMNIVSYWYSDKIALATAGAHPVSLQSHPELWRIVENLSITAGIPMPALYLIEDPSPNAFATGRNPEHAAVAVTSGLLRILDRNELEGVIAHELSHIGNRDTLVMTVVVVLVGFVTLVSDFFFRASFHGGGERDSRANAIAMVVGIALAILSPIVATLIQLAISRKREFLADASGALLTRYPEGLASALEKISRYGRPLARANHATAHLFIANPFGGEEEEKPGLISTLFMTHPPVEERIKALRG